jgi:hypothetical protein
VCYTNLQQNGPYVWDYGLPERKIMPDEALILVNNLQHDVLAVHKRGPKTGVMALAGQYFRTQVAGQAEGTVDAKQRDLACYLTFYTQLYGHDDRREWYKSVTEAFLKALARGQVLRASKRGDPMPRALPRRSTTVSSRWRSPVDGRKGKTRCACRPSAMAGVLPATRPPYRRMPVLSTRGAADTLCR